MKFNCLILIAILIGVSRAAETTDEECKAPPAALTCDEPKQQYQVFGLSSSAPLFSDAGIKAQCKKLTNNIFKTSSSKKAYEPFSGLITCGENEAITGIEMCFQVEVKYIAPFCTPLESGYRLDMDDIKGATNSPEAPGEVTCPDEWAVISLKLESDDDGNILVYIKCAEIKEE